ncbi:MAG: hypothetical protein H0U60_02460 [Blastocatellia bacterium]|nr:hypothetical protein [Blastocatellia bacterium]
MANIMEYQGDGSEFIEHIPSRNVLAVDFETLQQTVQDLAVESGLFVAGTGTADPLSIESEELAVDLVLNPLASELEAAYPEPEPKVRHAKAAKRTARHKKKTVKEEKEEKE